MKVCFVGIGSIAKRHIRNLHEICEDSGMELTIDALRRPGGNGNNPDYISHVYHSHKDMPKDYDVIFITNPTEYHADALIQLHDNAKHFFIEKPITSVSTIDNLKGFVPRPDSVYYVACPMRYTNVIEYLKKEINPSEVYSVRSISSSYLPDWRPGVDYRNTYSAHKDMGGGVAIDLIHEWDYLSYLFGTPVEVKSFIGKVSDLEIDSDDYAIYIARYKNMIAELHLDYFGRQTLRTVELYTKDETIVGYLETGEIHYLKSGKVVNLGEERDDYQKKELQTFLDAINGRQSVHNDIGEAIRILKLTQGITK